MFLVFAAVVGDVSANGGFTKLTPDGTFNLYPSLSGDGRFVSYTRQHDSGDELYLYDRRLSKEILLVEGKRCSYGMREQMLSADGRFIVYTDCVSHTALNNQIYLYDVQNAVSTLVTKMVYGGYPSEAHNTGPSISADGRFVAFTSSSKYLIENDENNTGSRYAYVYDSHTQEIQRVSDLPTGLSLISKNGQFVVTADRGITVHDLQAGTKKTVSPNYNYSPRRFQKLSDDGRYARWQSRNSYGFAIDFDTEHVSLGHFVDGYYRDSWTDVNDAGITAGDRCMIYPVDKDPYSLLPETKEVLVFDGLTSQMHVSGVGQRLYDSDYVVSADNSHIVGRYDGDIYHHDVVQCIEPDYEVTVSTYTTEFPIDTQIYFARTIDQETAQILKDLKGANRDTAKRFEIFRFIIDPVSMLTNFFVEKKKLNADIGQGIDSSASAASIANDLRKGNGTAREVYSTMASAVAAGAQSHTTQLANDPPRADYHLLAEVDESKFENVFAHENQAYRMFNTGLDALLNGLQYLDAFLITLERLQGAMIGGQANAIALQSENLSRISSLADRRLMFAAQIFNEIDAELIASGVEVPFPDIDALEALKQSIVAGEYNAQFVSEQLPDIGLSAAEINVGLTDLLGLLDLNQDNTQSVSHSLADIAMRLRPDAYHADSDGDGVVDAVDNCLGLQNVLQLNADGDGLGNECDADDDNDRLPDAWELSFDLDPLNKDDAELDSDRDGTTNLQEYLNGTNPIVSDRSIDKKNPNALISIIDFILR